MEFSDRLKTIMKVNNLTSSSFAEKVGVQRSGLSHILNGRNKASMEFLIKVLDTFPRVDAGWLITGKSPKAPTADQDAVSDLNKVESKEKKQSSSNSRPSNIKSIKKIVVFYSDNTFESYRPTEND